MFDWLRMCMHAVIQLKIKDIFVDDQDFTIVNHLKE